MDSYEVAVDQNPFDLMSELDTRRHLTEHFQGSFFPVGEVGIVLGVCSANTTFERLLSLAFIQ